MTAQTIRTRKQPAGPAGYLAPFSVGGLGINAGRVAEAYRMSKQQLAETIGLSAATVSKGDRQSSPKAQMRMTEMIEILARIQDWAGSEAQAMAWYRSQSIPALDGRTAEALVKSGQAGAVREYLDVMALGGFA
jgi:uncharacterized protein (DUF2384 family)